MNDITPAFPTRLFARESSSRFRPALMLMLLSLTRCAPGAGLADLPRASDTAYHLGAGDQVRVITYDETQLSNTFLVGDDGTVAFPLLGNVRAAGLTPDGLASQLSTSLEGSKLLTTPSVSVEVTQYRPISVLGEVTHPGQYPYQPGMTMLDAVALAGGFTYRAVTTYAADSRSEGNVTGGEPVEGKVYRTTVLEPGDVVTIFERYF